MNNSHEIRELLRRYVGAEIPLIELQEAFLPLSASEESDLVDAVDALLVRLSVNEIAEDEFRGALHDLVDAAQVRVNIKIYDGASTTLSDALIGSASVRAGTQDEAVLA